jgi:cupin fold WbuC family metalloprotein
MLTRVVNDQVLYAIEDFRSFSHRDIQQLATRALESETGRIRVCFHHSPQDVFHEMLIAYRRDAAYPPQMHTKSETSYYMCLGEATLFLIDENGAVTNELHLSPNISENGAVYGRVNPKVYRYLRVDSDVCVFLETRLGPFLPEDTVIAPFAIPSAAR